MLSVHQRAAMQQLSAKVFKSSFAYLHIYSPKSGDFLQKKNSKSAWLIIVKGQIYGKHWNTAKAET